MCLYVYQSKYESSSMLLSFINHTKAVTKKKVNLFNKIAIELPDSANIHSTMLLPCNLARGIYILTTGLFNWPPNIMHPFLHEVMITES